MRGHQGKSRAEGHFEVIAGKRMAEDGAKCFAFVHRYDTKPKRRLFEVLQSQGMQRIKWYLWHGNVFRALQTIEDLAMDIEVIEESDAQRKLLKALGEFERYIRANRHFIPNYGDRYRNGEAIATGFLESTVNQVVSKRMVKQQSMRWTERGAHLLLQIRTNTLNDELRSTFEGWYPDMKEVA